MQLEMRGDPRTEPWGIPVFRGFSKIDELAKSPRPQQVVERYTHDYRHYRKIET